MIKEKLSTCDKCGETRIEMEHERLQMRSYMCPGCATIRVIDLRGEEPEDEDKLPAPFVEYLRQKIAA